MRRTVRVGRTRTRSGGECGPANINPTPVRRPQRKQEADGNEPNRSSKPGPIVCQCGRVLSSDLFKGKREAEVKDKDKEKKWV